jgi:flagellar hook-basal body complex protein FliE
MSPLPAISATSPAQSIMPRPEIAFPETLRPPGVEAPGRSGEIAPGQPANDSFGSLLGRFVDEVNTRQNAASDAVHALQSGGNVSLHQAVIAMEEASISFQLMVEVRNKLLESYQELMRMQV